jgi:hypothetical protein
MPVPGWYSDPLASDQLRYWDGTIWTAYVHAPTEDDEESVPAPIPSTAIPIVRQADRAPGGRPGATPPRGSPQQAAAPADAFGDPFGTEPFDDEPFDTEPFDDDLALGSSRSPGLSAEPEPAAAATGSVAQASHPWRPRRRHPHLSRFGALVRAPLMAAVVVALGLGGLVGYGQVRHVPVQISYLDNRQQLLDQLVEQTKDLVRTVRESVSNAGAPA